MKGLKALAGLVLVSGLLAATVPATAGAAAYEHYVGCGVSKKAKRSHSCPKKAKKGAFFKSLNGTVNYTVCVKFPSRKPRKKRSTSTRSPRRSSAGTWSAGT
jgi:hypothetical protein